MNFWPHDAVGWIAIIVPSLGALGWLLNIYVKQPLDRLTAQFEIMKRDTDKELDDHERRLTIIESKRGIK